MNVSLTPHLDEYVNAKVNSGRYTSASEVIREALRLLEVHEQSRATPYQAFDRELERRILSLENGERVTPQQLKEHFRKRSADYRAKRA